MGRCIAGRGLSLARGLESVVVESKITSPCDLFEQA